MLRISAFGPNFVFRTNFVFATEFRLQRAPNRISSSHELRLQGRFSSSNFVFAHNLSFSSWRTISSSKASEFRLQGGDETGTQFPGSMHIYTHLHTHVAWIELQHVQDNPGRTSSGKAADGSLARHKKTPLVKFRSGERWFQRTWHDETGENEVGNRSLACLYSTRLDEMQITGENRTLSSKHINGHA